MATRPLIERRVVVGLDTPNTIQVPHDLKRSEAERWFKDCSGLPDHSPIKVAPHRTGNEVKFLIDGPDTFHEFVAAILTASRPGHFIYLTGLVLFDQFALIPGRFGTDLQS